MKKKQQAKVINFLIEDNIFNRYIDVYVGDKKLTISKITKKYGVYPEEMNKNYGGLSAVLKKEGMGDISLIWCEEPYSDLIAHECLHATYNILENAGIEFNRDTEEAYAYYQAFLIKIIDGKLSQLNKGKRK